ncbi:MAG: cyclic nucleotide-binding domain-containing protein [Spirochaetales bacterium]|nr:cyclic nucleotide-binding domain-containing protein [Spirochaetales bacterium]
MRTILDKEAHFNELEEIITFRFMSKTELYEMIAAGELLLYSDRERIITQGDTTQSFYAVVRGSVEVNVSESSGKDVYICTIGNGEVFGEAGIFMEVKRTANVVSLGDSIIFSLPRNKMIAFIRKHPVAGNKILMIIIYSLLKKLKEANQELAFERQSDVDQGDIDAIIKDFAK